MKSIIEVEQEIVEDFNWFETWPEKYQYIIELGQKLEAMPEKYKKEENKVKGCQSSVWIFPEQKQNGLYFHGDSDSVFVKGELALVLKVLQNRSIEEIIKAELKFLNHIGLKKHIAPTRANGLEAMIKQIKYYAIAHSAKNE